jgi:hypothetical protein
MAKDKLLSKEKMRQWRRRLALEKEALLTQAKVAKFNEKQGNNKSDAEKIALFNEKQKRNRIPLNEVKDIKDII